MKIHLSNYAFIALLAASFLAGCAGESDPEAVEAAIVTAGGPARDQAGSKQASADEIKQRGWAQPKPLSREDFQEKSQQAQQTDAENPAQD